MEGERIPGGQQADCDRGITASGEYVREGICAMDRVNGQVVPFGTKVILPNGKVLIVKDRLGWR